MDSQMGATELGFDVDRMIQVIETLILPKILKDLGEIQVTGAVFSMPGYAAILRELRTSEAYLSVRADLFAEPTVDATAPDTEILRAPTSVVSVKNATVLVSGSDAEIPPELLRYNVLIDGKAPVGEPSTIREIPVGEAGKTATYSVSIAAMDLVGNVDPTPVVTEVTVDGIAPKLVIVGERIVKLETTDAFMRWRTSDDLTADEKLRTKVEIFRIKDKKDPLSAELVETLDVAQGERSLAFKVREGSLYRAVVVVQDEVGNESRSSVLLDIAGSGCSISGGTSEQSLPFIIALMAAMTILRRRRD